MKKFLDFILFRTSNLGNKIIAMALYAFIAIVTMSYFFNFDVFQEIADAVGISYGFGTFITVILFLIITYIIHLMQKKK